MTNTGWTFKHEDAIDESGLHRNVTPTDARGLRLRLESGYTWMNQNDGRGWRQTTTVLREVERQERARAAHLASASVGFDLGTMQDASGRRESKLDAARGRKPRR